MRAALGVAVALAAVGAAALLAAGRMLVVADPLPPRPPDPPSGPRPGHRARDAPVPLRRLRRRALVARPPRRQDRPQRVREARQLLAHRELEDRALRRPAALARVSPRPPPAAAARAPRAHASRARCRTRR